MKFSKKKNVRDNMQSGSSSSKVKNRKEMRKEKRSAKKQHRRDYYSRRSKSILNKFSVNRESQVNQSATVQRSTLKQEVKLHRNSPNNTNIEKRVTNTFVDGHENISNDCSVESVKRGSLKKSSGCDPLILRKMEETAKHEKLQEDMRENRNLKLNEENEEEERLIKKLEKQLKLSKRKSNSVPKSFTADGLDYLLDVCDSEKIKQVASSDNAQVDSDSEFEEDLATAVAWKKEKDMEYERYRQSTSKSDPSSTSMGEGNCSEYHVTKQSSMASATESDSDSDFIDSELESETDDSSVYDCGDSGGNDTHRDDEYYGSDEDTYVDGQGNNSVWDSNNSDASNEGELMERKPIENSETEATCLQKSMKGKRVHFRDEDGSESECLQNKGKNAPKKMKLKPSDKRKSDAFEMSQPKIKKRKITTKTKQNNNEAGKYVRSCPSESDDSSECEASSSDSDGSQKISSSQSGVWEDIYGRLRDQVGNIITKQPSESGVYVPPALRAHHSRDDEQTQQRLQRLNRQVKGYFNRLTERNMASISSEIENLYNNNSRNDMNTTFTTILLESLVTRTMSLERLIMEHAALVACLHSRVGSDVGAHVLQSVGKQFDVLINGSMEIENKEIDNVIMIICYLYNFKVVHSQLIFDILRRLTSQFGSKEVELVLVILRTVGFGLRKDNPSDMKSLMVQLQEVAQISSAQCSESRVRFMLEVLLAVKNNNMTRIPGCDPGPVEQMRKSLRSLLSKGNISPELNISLQDLLLAEERGRWWVVGSAWAGQGPDNKTKEKKETGPTYSTELLELARRQRMNTDDRRNIFCILMTAQDYQEAYYNLMQLGLKGRQARDTVLVTLHCCLQEKAFNKYYAHVIQSICAHNRVYWVTLQFALWDKIRELTKLSPCQFSNLVQIMQYLLLQGVFTLIMFKIMDLTSLEKSGIRFLRQVLLGILSGEWEECELVFSSVAKVPSYKMFCTGLRIFLQQFVNSKISSEDSQQALLKERLERVDALLGGSLV